MRLYFVLPAFAGIIFLTLLPACANKGGLKSPSQTAAIEAKKSGKTADGNAQPTATDSTTPVTMPAPALQAPHGLSPVQNPTGDTPPAAATGAQ